MSSKRRQSRPAHPTRETTPPATHAATAGHPTPFPECGRESGPGRRLARRFSAVSAFPNKLTAANDPHFPSGSRGSRLGISRPAINRPARHRAYARCYSHTHPVSRAVASRRKADDPLRKRTARRITPNPPYSKPSPARSLIDLTHDATATRIPYPASRIPPPSTSGKERPAASRQVRAIRSNPPPARHRAYARCYSPHPPASTPISRPGARIRPPRSILRRRFSPPPEHRENFSKNVLTAPFPIPDTYMVKFKFRRTTALHGLG